MLKMGRIRVERGTLLTEEMKWLAALLAIQLLVGCDKGGDGATLESVEKTSPCKRTVTDRGAKMNLETWKEQIAEEQEIRREEIVENELVRSLPPFENALESDGSKFVARAFVIEKAEDGGISVIEGVHRRVPSDPEKYISESRPSGQYLVGSLAPHGGYGISASNRQEERFCLRLTDNGKFLHGVGVSGLLRLQGVKNKLTPPANKLGLDDG